MTPIVCLSVHLSVASDISEISEAIAIKLDTMTASVTEMHHMLIISTLTFTQGHADLILNHENKKYSIISDCLSYGNASHVNYIDLDLHARYCRSYS